MSRLPVVGSDSNTWGATLNDFLQVGHNAGGTLRNALPVYRAKDDVYGGGTLNDVSINAAQAAAAAAGGGIVFLDAGTWITQAAIVQTADHVRLVGAGIDSTIIQPASGSQFDAVSTAIPGTSGTAGFIRKYVGIENLTIDCSLQTGTTAGQGNGIHWYGVQYGSIHDVKVNGSKNFAIILDGDGTNFGYNCYLQHIVFEGCAAGLFTVASEANDLLELICKQANASLGAAQPAFTPQITAGYHMYLTTGY